MRKLTCHGNISANMWKPSLTPLVHLTVFFSLIDLYCQQLPLTLILSSFSPAPPTVPSFLLSLSWLLADVPYRPVPGPSVRESNSHPAIIRFAGVATVSVSNFASASLARTLLFIYFTSGRWLYITYLDFASQPLLVYFDLSVVIVLLFVIVHFHRCKNLHLWWNKLI